MLVKKSLTLRRHKTSLALEAEFWRALECQAKEQRVSVAHLIARIDESRKSAAGPRSLASAVRVWLLQSGEKVE